MFNYEEEMRKARNNFIYDLSLCSDCFGETFYSYDKKEPEFDKCLDSAFDNYEKSKDFISNYKKSKSFISNYEKSRTKLVEK
jgi:hypothetical protein